MNTSLPTILIVDDSAMTRGMIARVVHLTGLTIGSIVQASNGKDALDLLRAMPIHLVLADLNMPVMNGVEMIETMRKSDELRSIPVVVISAQPDPEQIERLKADGVNDYLAKPFTPEGVRKAIEPILVTIEESMAKNATASSGELNLSLAESFAEALETMAFISPELTEAHEMVPSGELTVARVLFTAQTCSGSLSLSAPKQFGAAVAKNCAAADADAFADDALKELANITCGLFLRKRIGGATGFVLAPPVIDSLKSASDRAAESDRVVFKADGFCVAAHVTPETVL